MDALTIGLPGAVKYQLGERFTTALNEVHTRVQEGRARPDDTRHISHNHIARRAGMLALCELTWNCHDLVEEISEVIETRYQIDSFWIACRNCQEFLVRRADEAGDRPCDFSDAEKIAGLKHYLRALRKHARDIEKGKRERGKSKHHSPKGVPEEEAATVT